MNNVIRFPMKIHCQIVMRAVENKFPHVDPMSDLMRTARIETRRALFRARSRSMSIEAGSSIVRRSQIIVPRKHGDAA